MNKLAIPFQPIILLSERVKALIVSQVFALVWWGIALQVRLHALAPAWIDQENIFMPAARQVADPFQVGWYTNPPWAALLLAPFGVMPLSLSTLAQTALYFAILTALIFKFGGGLKAVLITLTSFVAFDAVIELNIDWLVALGLLVPPTWSGPLLLVKPQVAPGYWLSLKPRQLVYSVVFVLVVLLISLILWPGWPQAMRDAVAPLTERSHNLAPMSLLPPIISVAIGGVLTWCAVKRHDPLIGILAGLFFVPYIALYSLLIPFALAAIRWPRVTLLVSIVMWLIYGGAISYSLFVIAR
jgi:hypothetical protein